MRLAGLLLTSISALSLVGCAGFFAELQERSERGTFCEKQNQYRSSSDIIGFYPPAIGQSVCTTNSAADAYEAGRLQFKAFCGEACYRDESKTEYTLDACQLLNRLAAQERKKGAHVSLHYKYSSYYRAICAASDSNSTASGWLSSYDLLELDARAHCKVSRQELAEAAKRKRLAEKEAASRAAERDRAKVAAKQAAYEASGQWEASQICDAWSVEALMQQQIDRDKEAEAISGVVNLATRHQAANTIVFMRERREAATATYREKTGKSFNLAQCQK